MKTILSIDKSHLTEKPKVIIVEEPETHLSHTKMYELIKRATKIEVHTEKLLNWGESKGLQADSTLIYLTDKLIEAYKSKGKINISEATKRKFYVAATRAKFTVGLVVPDDFDNTHIKLPFWKME